MTISVIIPVYNKEKVIQRTIKSVLDQNYPDFEIIIIDDGSEDSSQNKIKEMQKIDKRIKYFYQKNQGVSVARNYGIKMASGKYISFLDADDIWDKSFLKKMKAVIADNDVTYCGHHIVENDNKREGKIKFLQGDILVDYINNVCTPNTNCWLIKRNLVIKNNIEFPVHLSWGEDMIFFATVLIHCKTVKACKDYLTEYHYHSPNNLSSNSIEKVDDHIHWMNELRDKILALEKNENTLAKSVTAIDSYRMPAGIIYRLLMNLNNYDIITLKSYFEKSEKYINNIKITNGLKSFKLLLSTYLLKIRLWYMDKLKR